VTAAGLTTEHLEYGIVYECSGGSLPTGPTPVIYTFGPTSSPSGTYGGVGGTTPTYEKVNYTPPPVPAPNILMIFNNVIDPCLRAQVETSISEKFNSKIPRIVNSAFRTNEIFDVDIVDVDFLPSDQMGGATLSQSEDYCRATIELNANILRNSSKEYILATVYHELLHAYLDYLDAETNYDNTQHEIMANNYVSIMASDLQENFGLSGKEANALAWGGLHETTAWQSVTNKNYILEVNQKHKNGTTGTKCN
jgi:hypothetical protein